MMPAADHFFKTKMCPFNGRGQCLKGSRCTYAHAQEEVQPAVNLSKTKICRAWQRSGCARGADCKYAHGVGEIRNTDGYFKTTLCVFHDRGFCPLGDSCRHAHGVGELRDRNYRRAPVATPRSGAEPRSTCNSSTQLTSQQTRGEPTTPRAPDRGRGRRGTIERAPTQPAESQTLALPLWLPLPRARLLRRAHSDTEVDRVVPQPPTPLSRIPTALPAYKAMRYMWLSRARAKEPRSPSAPAGLRAYCRWSTDPPTHGFREPLRLPVEDRRGAFSSFSSRPVPPPRSPNSANSRWRERRGPKSSPRTTAQRRFRGSVSDERGVNPVAETPKDAGTADPPSTPSEENTDVPDERYETPEATAVSTVWSSPTSSVTHEEPAPTAPEESSGRSRISSFSDDSQIFLVPSEAALHAPPMLAAPSAWRSMSFDATSVAVLRPRTSARCRTAPELNGGLTVGGTPVVLHFVPRPPPRTPWYCEAAGLSRTAVCAPISESVWYEE
eukprot:Polyplicarium_translucidae@DN2527_c0_g1_i2.p1